MQFDAFFEKLQEKGMNVDHAFSFASILNEYHSALLLLKHYDEHGIEAAPPELIGDITVPTEEGVRIAIAGAKSYLEMKGEVTGQFGLVKSGGNPYTAIKTVMQNVCGKEMYPTIEEKAANLFYFLIKNHYFVDGNKRIGSLILLWFLDINDRILFSRENFNVFSYNAIFALATVVAESKPHDREMIVRLIVLIIRGYFFEASLKSDED